MKGNALQKKTKRVLDRIMSLVKEREEREKKIRNISIHTFVNLVV